jgi:prolipoprotein diacylglyceryltransferase
VSGNIITSHLIVSPWNFTTGQIYSFLMIVGGLIAFFFFKNKAQTNVKSK